MKNIQSFKSWRKDKINESRDVKELIGKKFRPFVSQKPEHFVEIVDIDDNGITTYKHLDDGEEKTADIKNFLDSYIRVND